MSILSGKVRSYMKNADLIQLVIAVYLGSVLMDFLASVVDNAMVPSLMKILGYQNEDKLDEIKIKFAGVIINIGHITLNAIKLIFALTMGYYIIEQSVGFDE